MLSSEYWDIFKNTFVTDLVHVQPFKSSCHIELTIFCFAFLFSIPLKFAKYVNFIKWYMLFHGWSLSFIVQAHCSLFPKRCFSFHKIRQNISVCVNWKRIIQKCWSIFNLLHLLTSYLFNKKNHGVAGGLKIMYQSSVSKEPRGTFRTMSSV